MGKGSKRGAAALCIALGLTSCVQLQEALSIGPSRGDTLEEVDSLLGRIEHAYVECERAELRVTRAVERLHDLVAPDFDADPSAALAEYREAVHLSEQQAERLEKSVQPLEEAAASFFENWERDLEAFQSEQLRRRSHTRMNATRSRYVAIAEKLGPALPMLREVNVALADSELYLRNDFNHGSVRALEGEVRDVTAALRSLVERLEKAREAARAYVEEAALRGQLVQPRQAPASTTSRSL